MEDAKKIGTGIARLVTLEGEILEQSGLVSGGRNESSILLSTQLKKLDSELSEMKTQKDAFIQELYDLREEESAARARKANIDISVKTIEMEMKLEEEKLAEQREMIKRKDELLKEIESL